MDPIRLLCDISEMNWIFSGSDTIDAFLKRIVNMVAHHMEAEVCSIYMVDAANGDLVLRANVGLADDAVGRIRLASGEGLTGLSVKEMRPISTPHASRHPGYRFFEGTDEEKYDAFLAVPIARGIYPVGALTIQRGEPMPFRDEDMVVMQAISSQLANIIENARLLQLMGAAASPAAKSLSEAPPGADATLPSIIKGRGVSGGTGYGGVLILDKARSFDRYGTDRKYPPFTLQDLSAAIGATEKQLRGLQHRVEQKLSDAASLIFSAHLLMLKDSHFTGRMQELAAQGTNPPEAVMAVGREYAGFFAGQGNPYLREKADDVRDLVIRIMANLLPEVASHEYRGKIVAAADLYPSDVLMLSAEEISGIILIAGGAASHLSILVRSLRLPLIIANVPALLNCNDGTAALLDADNGTIFINPSRPTIDQFEKSAREREAVAGRSAPMTPRTATKDGLRISLYSNINLLTDAVTLKSLVSDGIGLYRTEFPFLVRSTFPTEEEQFAIYSKLIEIVGKEAEITFRTLDIGGDKVLPYYGDLHEKNPFLGIRSIRFSLQNRPLFKEQIRAILRAGSGSKIRILFPMISSKEELLESRLVVAECAGELAGKGIRHNEEPKIGVMIEIPSVLEIMAELVDFADFFSIGTNDFIQYMLAVDRTNEKVADLYCAHHPAVLRGIRRVMVAAAEKGREVSVCGEMAHSPRYLPFLIGAGIRALSVDPQFLPLMQAAISKIDSGEAEVIAGKMLEAGTRGEVENIMEILMDNK
jgi:phosphotransferase system enzyme I (PtsP)